MANVQSLRSYLVSLGFSVNTAQAAQFNNAIQTAAQIVNTNTKNMMANLTKLGTVTVGMFEAVGVSVVALADKVATADQSYRLFGQRMYLDTQHAKQLKIALDALGEPLEAIAFDPELHRRYEDLAKLQTQLQGMLGPDFKQTMIELRNAQFELTRFRVEALYFRDVLIKDIFQALGGEKLAETLRTWNDYIIQNIPMWANVISTHIVPVLKDAWLIMQDLWRVAKDFAQLFTNLIGILSGDPALEGTVSFEKFAAALERVANALATIIHYASMFAGTIAGAGIGGSIGGTIGLFTGGPAGMAAGAATGTAIGAGVGGITDLIRSTFHNDAVAPSAGLDDVARAVSLVESGGHQFTRTGQIMRSSAGALGIMQLMPSTAAQLGVDPYNAQQNYAGGRAYLNQLHNKFGNWHDALAAYNWGPGHVENALKQHHAFPPSVEGYVSSVEGNITIGAINITQPNLNHEQVANAVAEGVAKHTKRMTSANLAELRSIYG
jgi:Transglycosylase SLT domain